MSSSTVPFLSCPTPDPPANPSGFTGNGLKLTILTTMTALSGYPHLSLLPTESPCPAHPTPEDSAQPHPADNHVGRSVRACRSPAAPHRASHPHRTRSKPEGRDSRCFQGLAGPDLSRPVLSSIWGAGGRTEKQGEQPEETRGQGLRCAGARMSVRRLRPCANACACGRE